MEATLRLVGVGLTVFALACGMARSGALSGANRFYAEGKYLQAIAKADQALAYGNPSPEDAARAHLLKAKCLEAADEADEAIALYQFVHDTYPGTPQAHQARGRLNKLANPSR